ncbi:MAG: signal recognition particle protein [Eubacteriales bacterium]|nr:signal recognition particle protein [Eubacteriales bacterium]
MAFESLSEKLQNTFKNIKGKGVLTEKDIDTAMHDVKLALLEADVNYKVVKDFVKETKEACMGEEVMQSLTPAQQVIKIVDGKLTELLGGQGAKLTYASSGFTVIMLVGLQGTGKTTTAGKLANYLKQCGKKPMLAACDIYRPAAIDQLEVVGKAVNTPVWTERGVKDAVKIAQDARREAELKGFNVLIVDTAGRLQIDQPLMDELKDMRNAIKPHTVLLVLDALTGQDAVNAAQGFNEQLGFDGMILTKMDGDARGGAALSVKKVTGKPILFMGTGEKYDALEPFQPDRMANRILGMGDVLSLIETAEQAYDDQQAMELEEKIRKNRFTLDDFLEQMQQLRKMGGLEKLIRMIPGISASQLNDMDFDQGEAEIHKMESIIYSMTKEERNDPTILNASRRKRIAAGCGRSVSEINSLIKKYDEARKMMKKFSNPGAMKRNRMMKGLF